MLPSHISKSPGYHIHVGLLFACIAFDVFVYLWSVILPDVARAVGILQELLLGGPVVFQSDVAGAFVGIEIEPVVGVVNIGRLGNVAHHILRNQGAWLVAKGIDAGTVVHVLGVVVDEVGVYFVVLHAHQVAVPSPAKRNTCIGYVVDGVMLDIDATHVACTDSYTAPVFVGDIVELAVAHLLLCAHLTEVGGLVGQMGFQSLG